MNKNYSLDIYLEVAHIHMKCINQGFLPTLGESFLAMLYQSIDENSDSVLLVERKNGIIVGFVTGGCGVMSIYRHMLKRWPKLFLVLFSSLINPFKLKKILEIICFNYRKKPTNDLPKAELFSIAVLESARNTGVAERLYELLKRHFEGDGKSAFCIVAGEELDAANRFYRRMGAKPIARIRVHSGRESILYRHDLS